MATPENLNPSETDLDHELNDPEEEKQRTPDQVGSSEFYQGEKVIEDITLPGKKKSIKAEAISKEEIYKDKIEKQKAFIASLGRKNGSGEKSDQGQPEYVEEKSSQGKKRLFMFLLVIVLAAAVGGGYWLWNNKKQKTASKETGNSAVIPINQEAEQPVPEEEQPAPEIKPPVLVDPAKLTVKVLNEGATAGSAGKVKTLLVGKGYAKAAAGNGEFDSTGTFIYYSGQAASPDAEAVSKVLSDNGTESKIEEALTSEQKSADIVVILGK